MNNIVFIKGELITPGNEDIPESFFYHSTVSEIGEQVAESWLRIVIVQLKHLFSRMPK